VWSRPHSCTARTCWISGCDKTHWHGCTQESISDAATLLLHAGLQLREEKNWAAEATTEKVAGNTLEQKQPRQEAAKRRQSSSWEKRHLSESEEVGQ